MKKLQLQQSVGKYKFYDALLEIDARNKRLDSRHKIGLAAKCYLEERICIVS